MLVEVTARQSWPGTFDTRCILNKRGGKQTSTDVGYFAEGVSSPPNRKRTGTLSP